MRAEPPPRRASLVLVTPEGEPLGELPEIPVATPWWQDAAAVVDAARAAWGIDAVVVRMLDSELPRPQGGRVTYLAETGAALPATAREALGPFRRALTDHPLRPAYAQVGGPTADLRWADGVLAARGLVRTGPARQERTWNLSSLWELPLEEGTAWLKVVPPFFAHEGAVLDRLRDGPVPGLLGADGGRLLLEGVRGEDRYGASGPELLDIVTLLVGLQTAWVGRVDELLAAGVPDMRGPALVAATADVAARRGGDLAREERARLNALVADLPARLADVDACGIPDSLLHGDFHPGNVRGEAGRLTLLDWGDSAVAHPLLDLRAFESSIPAAEVPRVRTHWFVRWRAAVPGCDPERAADLLAPVAAARLAVVYQRFVDHVEPVERRHHDDDVVDSLRAAARLWGR